ncbi:MAG: hypothetical protein JNK78_02085 [Planctomycetes bacterium]|nr:hypothetical protein [Planctomycetota bacterium]
MTRSWCAILVAAWLGACASSPPPRIVAVDSLLPAAVVARDGDVLTGAIANSLRGDAAFVARGTAARFAEEAAAALVLGRSTDFAGQQAVATALPGSTTAWSQVVRERAAHPDTFDAIGTARRNFVAALERGDIDDAVSNAAGAVRLAPAGPVRGMALAWHAFALARAGDRADEATARFAAAIDELRGPSPVLAAQVGLVWHTTRPDGSVWSAAVERLAAATVANGELAAPLAWQRATATRGDLSWPANVAEAARAALGAPDVAWFGASPGDDLVDTMTARMHFRRGEAMAALVAFRRVDRAGGAPPVRGLAQVGQAKALALLGRTGDARAVLSVTVESDDPVARAAGLAQLGAIDLAEERPAVARELLRRALESEARWSDRAGALGNLAIANWLLDDPEGAADAWCRARKEFAANGLAEDVMVCLENEAALRGAREPEVAATARRTLDAVRARGPAALADE